MKRTKLLLVLTMSLLSNFSNAQNLTIELDLSNAKKTIEIFENTQLSETQIGELIQLESSKALLKKLETKDSVMTQAITKAYTHDTMLTRIEKRFQFGTIKQNLKELSEFINTLENNLSDIEARLKQSLGPFIPKGQDVKIRIMGITGGNSTGYTFGDGDVFHISLHHMKNDIEFFFQICRHELFHNLQALWFDTTKIHEVLRETEHSSPDYYTCFMLESLYMEGTATYLDDLKNAKETIGNKDWLDRYHKNIKREKYIFWLFDRLIVNLQTNYSNDDANKTYGTFFLTTFDELGYYMGAVITDYLLKNSLEKDLKDYMGTHPLRLISDYISLSNNRTDSPYVFSDAFIKIVNDLSSKVDTIIYKN